MKKCILITMVLLLAGVVKVTAQEKTESDTSLVLVTPSGARQKVEFRIAPVGGMHFGDTRFNLDFTYQKADSSLGTGGSELVFPLDVTEAGVEFGFRTLKGDHQVWGGNLRLLFAVNDPGKKMTDRDWINSNNAIFDWSSTKSTVDGSLTELELQGTRLLVSGRTVELAALLGVGYQKIKQRMIDLNGWQFGYDINDSLVVYVIDARLLAGTYEIRYIRPEVGLALRLLMGSFCADLKPAVSPFLQVNDVDDHVLRYFKIKTDGRGFGYGGSVNLSFEPKSARRIIPRVDLGGDFFSAQFDVSGYREYYRNNPDENASRGDRFAEQHKVKTTQYGLHLSLGAWF